MAYTTIDDPSAHFNTVLYTGNGADNRSITGVGFQPDWVWYKERNNAIDHRLVDSTRGATKLLFSNDTDAEFTDANELQAFESDGFQVGDDGSINGNNDTYVAWNWKANGGTTSSNTDGSITSTVQANTTAGFSIVTYTGTGSNATIGHGLGATPKTYWIKRRSSGTADWYIYHSSIGATKNLRLNKTNASSTDSGIFNDTEPTSSVFSLGSSFSNTSSKDYVAYCFAEKQGYSKFGTYTGNGSSDGPFAYTGFKSAWLMIKRTDSTNHWTLQDNARESSNVVQKFLLANEDDAEDTSAGQDLDFLSNGFKIRNSNTRQNASGGSYIFMAFAEHPFVSSEGVPVTAR